MRKLIYLLPFVIMALAGCSKASSDSTPVPVPSGTFSGTFKILRQDKNNVNLPYDTVTKIPFVMTLNTTTGFQVVSDTSTIHAGSHGDYAVNGTYAYFDDKTYPKTGTPAKIHLSGYYPYGYDGTNFQFYASFADTLVYLYTLKKTSN